MDRVGLIGALGEWFARDGWTVQGEQGVGPHAAPAVAELRCEGSDTVVDLTALAEYLAPLVARPVAGASKLEDVRAFVAGRAEELKASRPKMLRETAVRKLQAEIAERWGEGLTVKADRNGFTVSIEPGCMATVRAMAADVAARAIAEAEHDAAVMAAAIAGGGGL